MKKGAALILLLLTVSSCGEDTSNSPVARSVQVRIQEPADLAKLEPGKRTSAISLSDLAGGSPTNFSLSPSAEKSVFGGETGSITPSRYLMTISLYHPLDPSRVLVDGIAETGAVRDVVVAVYAQPIDVVDGEQTIIVDTKPGDFSMNIDDDGDGLTNLQEILGSTDPTKKDTDGDGVVDGKDAFPNNSKESSDQDGDGIGDNADNCPKVANTDQKDTNHNGVGDACDPDMDGDSLLNGDEVKAGTDPLNPDTDGDGIGDGKDNCSLISNPNQANHGIHALGDACDPDSDGDGVLSGKDNCPFTSNADQAYHGSNGQGDVCNPDIDTDGVLNSQDNCPFTANSNQGDVNHNGIGDLCDSDADGDGLLNTEENTPGADGAITNWLVADTDGDGVPDKKDNCSITSNTDQASNGDSDGEGDACDCDPGDGNIATDKAVFVGITGDDSKTGARNDPVKTVQKAIQVAQATGKTQVYLGAGTYTGNVTMAAGISVYGGFNVSSNGSSCQKKLAQAGADINQTIITAKSGPTVSFQNISADTHLEGVTVQNLATSGDQELISIISSASSSTNNVVIEDSYLTAPSISKASVTAVYINNASPLIENSVIDAGNSQESIAVNLVDSPAAKFVNDTIRGGGSTTTSTVVDSSGSVAAFINNIMYTEEGNTQRVLYFRDSTPSQSILCKNNLMFGVQGSSPDKPKLYQDASPALHAYSAILQVNNIVDGQNPGGPFDGNIRLTSDGTDAGTVLQLTDIMQDPAHGNFRLAVGSIAIDRGINPFATIGVNVLKDHDATVRPQGASWDMGAFEK